MPTDRAHHVTIDELRASGLTPATVVDLDAPDPGLVNDEEDTE